MTRQIRIGNVPAADEVQGEHAHARSPRWRLMEDNKIPGFRGRDPKRLMVLGCIKYGPKTSNEIVKYLYHEGCTVATDVANVYRIIRQMTSAGLIRGGHGKRKSFELTKHGERYCPDEETFHRLMDATRIVLGIKEAGFVREPEKPKDEEKTLAEAASDALSKIEGVVSEEILAPLRKLIESVSNTGKGQ